MMRFGPQQRVQAEAGGMGTLDFDLLGLLSDIGSGIISGAEAVGGVVAGGASAIAAAAAAAASALGTGALAAGTYALAHPETVGSIIGTGIKLISGTSGGTSTVQPKDLQVAAQPGGQSPQLATTTGAQQASAWTFSNVVPWVAVGTLLVVALAMPKSRPAPKRRRRRRQ